MKKLLVSFLIIFIFICTINTVSIYATNDNQVSSDMQGEESNLLGNGLSDETKSELKDLKEKSNSELQEFIEKYGSQTYGIAAYILDKVRIYSIPLCFVGIAIGAIYQYVIGIRKLDVRDKGFGVVIAFVTVLIICQILPLIFAIVVKGWRG